MELEETVRGIEQINGTGRESEIKPATIGDSERHAVTPWTEETVRDSKQPWETVRDIQILLRTKEIVRDTQQP